MIPAGKDYRMQNTDLIFPPGTEALDVQCLGIPLIDNDRPDGERNFTVRITSFTSLVRVVPGFETKTVTILDNDGMLHTQSMQGACMDNMVCK